MPASPECCLQQWQKEMQVCSHLSAYRPVSLLLLHLWLQSGPGSTQRDCACCHVPCSPIAVVHLVLKRALMPGFPLAAYEEALQSIRISYKRRATACILELTQYCWFLWVFQAHPNLFF